MPKGKATHGSYEEYAQVMGGILEAAGIPGFLSGRRDRSEGDNPEDSRWGPFVGRWFGLFGESEVTSRELCGMILGRLTPGTFGPEWSGGDEELKSSFDELIRLKYPPVQVKRMARLVSKQKDRIYGEHRIVVVSRAGANHANVYQLRHRDGRPPDTTRPTPVVAPDSVDAAINGHTPQFNTDRLND